MTLIKTKLINIDRFLYRGLLRNSQQADNWSELAAL